MNISERSEGPHLVLGLAGRLDSSTSKSLEDVLLDQMAAKPAVVLDLQEIQYVSSAGLRVLLKAAKVAKSKSHRLVLAGLNPQVQEVFDISGFSTIFAIHPDARSALASL